MPAKKRYKGEPQKAFNKRKQMQGPARTKANKKAKSSYGKKKY